MNITIYSTASGQICRTMTLHMPPQAIAAILALNLGDGEAWAEGAFSPEAFRFRGGEPVEIGPAPGPWAAFDAEVWAWTDPRTSSEHAAELNGAKITAIAGVNDAAGVTRARYITVIPGQEMLYILKDTEARAFIADPAPDLVEYPLVAAEIGITAPSPYEVAQVYVNMAAMLRQLAAAIETMRLGAIAAIETASNLAAVEAARAAFLANLSASGL